MKNKDITFDHKTQFLEAFYEEETIIVRVSERPENFKDYSYIKTKYGLTHIKNKTLELINAAKETI